MSNLSKEQIAAGLVQLGKLTPDHDSATYEEMKKAFQTLNVESQKKMGLVGIDFENIKSPLVASEHAENMAAAQTIVGDAQPPLELELICRRCGEAYRRAGDNEAEGHEIAEYIQEFKREVHHCKDSFWGVADLIGVSRRAPTNTSSPEKNLPDFLPGGKVRINAKLHSTSLNCDYYLRLVSIMEDKVTVVLLHNDGGRWSNAFPAKRDADNYIVLLDYREFFPQIME